MPRKIVRIGLAFTFAGFLLPFIFMAIWAGGMNGAPPSTQATYRSVVVFFWPTGMALSGIDFARYGYPVKQAAATLVTIVENATLYAVLGFLVGWAVNYFRPDTHRFDEAAAEDKLERARLAKAAGKTQ